MLLSAVTDESRRPAKLELDQGFECCLVEVGDELYRNGIFEFNITRLLAFIDAHARRFPIESVAVAEIPDYGGSALDEDAIHRADLSHPILLVEIAPQLYSVIDGNHRVGRARRDGVAAVPGRKIACPVHVTFLTSSAAYENYVEYWNTKVNALQRERKRRTSAAGRPG